MNLYNCSYINTRYLFIFPFLLLFCLTCVFSCSLFSGIFSISRHRFCCFILFFLHTNASIKLLDLLLLSGSGFSQGNSSAFQCLYRQISESLESGWNDIYRDVVSIKINIYTTFQDIEFTSLFHSLQTTHPRTTELVFKLNGNRLLNTLIKYIDFAQNKYNLLAFTILILTTLIHWLFLIHLLFSSFIALH